MQYRHLARTRLTCEAGLGLDYSRGNARILLCHAPAVWVQTERPYAALCDECKQRLEGAQKGEKK